MIVGLDVDGILANFFKAYEDIIVEATGVDKFPARYPVLLPPTWNWPEFYGYDKKVISEVWRYIKQSPTFWTEMTALPYAKEFLEHLDKSDHEVYFITDRPGICSQMQTQLWLADNGFYGPNVIISRKGKGVVAAALSLDVYIDDKGENIVDVVEKAPGTRVYMLKYPYNEEWISKSPRTLLSLQDFEVALEGH